MINKLFDIPLNTIKRIELNHTATAHTKIRNNPGPNCIFSIITDSLTYYCGLMLKEEMSTLSQNARGFYNILKMAYLPFVKGHRKSIKITAPKFEAKV